MREVAVIDGNMEGFRRAAQEVVAAQKRMETASVEQVRHVRTMADEFEKIPRRMIVAGGSAMAFAATIGLVRRGIAGWNEELDKASQKLKDLNAARQEYITRQPTGERAPLTKSLVEEAKRSPLTLDQISGIRGAAAVTMPGAAPADREMAVRAGKYMEAIRGGGAGFTTAIGRAQAAYPDVGVKAVANMLYQLRATAGVGAEEAGGMLAGLSKQMGGGGLTGQDLPTVLALTQQASMVMGGQGGQAISQMFTRLYSDEMAKELRIAPSAWRRMSLQQKMEMVAKKTAGRPEMAVQVWGRREAARAFSIIGAPGARANIEQYRQGYVAAGASTDLLGEREYREYLAQDPTFRASQEKAIWDEIPALRLLEEMPQKAGREKRLGAVERAVGYKENVPGIMTRETEAALSWALSPIVGPRGITLGRGNPYQQDIYDTQQPAGKRGRTPAQNPIIVRPDPERSE